VTDVLAALDALYPEVPPFEFVVAHPDADLKAAWRAETRPRLVYGVARYATSFVQRRAALLGALVWVEKFVPTSPVTRDLAARLRAGADSGAIHIEAGALLETSTRPSRWHLDAIFAATRGLCSRAHNPVASLLEIAEANISHWLTRQNAAKHLAAVLRKHLPVPTWGAILESR